MTDSIGVESFEARLLSSEPGPRCAVIGLGFIGSTLMDALRVSRIETHGFDRDARAVVRYRARRDPAGELGDTTWSVGTDVRVLDRADVIFVAVRAPVDARGLTDLEPLENAGRCIRGLEPRERLIVVVSTLPPGTTRRFASSCSEGRSDIFVVHSPERLSVGHDWRMLRRLPHLVGGVDVRSSRLGLSFLGRVFDQVVPVSAPEVSELSKLLENAFISVGVALIGEITRIAHGLGIPARDVTEAAATKSFGYHAFHPGPGIGGHCLPNDLAMLAQIARSLGFDAALVEAAAQVAALQPRLVVDRAESVLSGAEHGLRGARVLLVGMGFKPGTADTTASPAEGVVRELRRRKSSPCYVDSRVDSFSVDGEDVPRVEVGELESQTFRIALVLAGDPAVSSETLERSAETIVDAGGGFVLAGGPLNAHRL